MAQLNTTLVNKDGDSIYPRTTTEGIIDLDDVLLTKSAFKPFEDEINSTHDSVESIKTANTSWSDWSKEGMSLLNGAQQYAGDQDYPRFRTRLVNGNRQVQLMFRIKNLTAGAGTPYVGFPTTIQPATTTQLGYSSPTTNGRTASWTVINGAIALHGNSDSKFDIAYWYPFFAQWEVN